MTDRRQETHASTLGTTPRFGGGSGPSGVSSKLLVADLPSPPYGRSGWPWTEHSADAAAHRSLGSQSPRITIITPTLNQGHLIEETIRSVLLQGYPNLEYMIFDGGSTDRTLEVIGKYARWLTHWESKPDRGQAHAINKGIDRATGDIIHWINSDDLLPPATLHRIANAFKEDSLIAGSVHFFGDGEWIEANTNLSPAGLINGFPGTIYHQPGVWLPRSAFANDKRFNESFHYSFDWEFTVRWLRRNPAICYLDAVLASFRLHEASKTVALNARFLEEQRRALRSFLAEPGVADLHAACRHRLDVFDWNPMVGKLIDDRGRSRLSRACELVRGMCAKPRYRINRLSIGALRRILTSSGALV